MLRFLYDKRNTGLCVRFGRVSLVLVSPPGAALLELCEALGRALEGPLIALSRYDSSFTGAVPTTGPGERANGSQPFCSKESLSGLEVASATGPSESNVTEEVSCRQGTRPRLGLDVYEDQSITLRSIPFSLYNPRGRSTPEYSRPEVSLSL